MSSKRQARRRTCEAKRRHPTEEAAWAAVRVMAGKGFVGMRPYHYAFCGGGWHIGHTHVGRGDVGGRK